jgi:hypothetical protein
LRGDYGVQWEIEVEIARVTRDQGCMFLKRNDLLASIRPTSKLRCSYSRNENSFDARLKTGASLFCSHEIIRDLYFSGRADTMHGEGSERCNPVIGGASPSSLHWWEIAIIDVAPDELYQEFRLTRHQKGEARAYTPPMMNPLEGSAFSNL